MLRAFTLFLLLSLLLSYCARVAPNSQVPPTEDPESYEVYSVILNSFSKQHAKSMVIRAETKGEEMCLQPEKESKKLIGDAITNYVRLNGKTWPLQERFNIEQPYKLMKNAEVEKAIEGKPIFEFYLIELSAVGFNSEKTIAVVYMGYICGGLCGAGGFHVLQKKDGIWTPLKWKGDSCHWVA